MDRRKFLSRFLVAAGASAVMPLVAFDSSSEAAPAGKEIRIGDFEWFHAPVARVLARVTVNGRSISLFTIIAAKTMHLRLMSSWDVDLTQDQVFINGRCYYSNPLLLGRAKQLGFTHLFEFTSVPNWEGTHRVYFVRGARLPKVLGRCG